MSGLAVCGSTHSAELGAFSFSQTVSPRRSWRQSRDSVSKRRLECEAAQILQPHASKTGGITDTKKIADLPAVFRRPFAPHTSMSGINSAATLALLATCSNTLIYEADLSALNPFRDELVHPRATNGSDGCVEPFDGPCLGIEVDESAAVRYPGIPGPSYV